ncbi:MULTISPECIES: bifunctional 2-polyprenyl-6-hydroxyphenol methylase/3-demethylubiquinol 3-O-methyltransferase UbiG [unclassified Fusibacter]|uniref:class I SAM-dependent methyltransferase n=1 Tax=unclassified Fusibacter TaxID=2624464 RepID=UPI0010131235|nr:MULTISPECIES: class I SAM-dependent methyltransferase [unclassified Fusibacter]MCK8059985.1 class I SAM-dependent methyltransferase [Fusibacter sp. A2]NPE22125.1 class I SAM-dependent methyltransferase [Fusibacter sp. A1]RXV60903.1 class I SAM-dependent methyltransferase [Fusibacter sp. A1]
MKAVQPEGNYFDKYENKKKLIQLIMKGYFKDFDRMLASIEFNSVYEAGCGEGHISQHVYKNRGTDKKNIKILASDISERIISKAKVDYPHIDFQVSTIYHLNESTDSYDLTIACEVLEHLEKPEMALNEIFRITRKYVLLSVPNEPIWRIANVLRGKYLMSLGNTPGHINHWNRKKITDLLSSYGEIVEVSTPFPWTMILCRKNDNAIS